MSFMRAVVRISLIVGAIGVDGGVAVSTATVKAGRECTIRGTPAGEEIAGTSGPDVICAGAGDDSISGRGGRDTILGGPGDDVIAGGRDSDTLGGGRGWDQLEGGDGIDQFSGYAGGDCFATKDGFGELVRGGKGNDHAWADRGTPDGNAPDDLRSIEEEGRTCAVRPVA